MDKNKNGALGVASMGNKKTKDLKQVFADMETNNEIAEKIIKLFEETDIHGRKITEMDANSIILYTINYMRNKA